MPTANDATAPEPEKRPADAALEPKAAEENALTPGRTAFAAMNFPFGSLRDKFLVVQVFMVGLLVSVLFRLPWWISVGCLAAGLIALGLIALSARMTSAASARERAAGYTTLNGTELDLEQRHPVTGAVIRAAGAPALLRREFAELVKQR